MQEPVQSDLASAGPASPAEPVITPDQAVERCMTAYQRAYNASAAKGKHPSECRCDGGHAFRLVMPSTGTLDGVQAFIACIIRGIHLRIWICNEEMRLFYAAQVAVSAHKRVPAKKK